MAVLPSLSRRWRSAPLASSRTAAATCVCVCVFWRWNFLSFVSTVVFFVYLLHISKIYTSVLELKKENLCFCFSSSGSFFRFFRSFCSLYTAVFSHLRVAEGIPLPLRAVHESRLPPNVGTVGVTQGARQQRLQNLLAPIQRTKTKRGVCTVKKMLIIIPV